MRRRAITGIASLLAIVGCGGPPKLALTPPPLQDDDRYHVPEQPADRKRDDYYDILDYTIFKQVSQLADVPRDVRALAGSPKQAMNTTPLDEVLDSTWFTNRMGRRRLTVDELRQGPLHPQGPDVDNVLTVVAGKTAGVTPGFTLEDSRGARFIIKPDPLDHPELATGADAIGTRIVWAFGFNVPEDYLVRIRPEQLRIGPKATIRMELGKRRPLTQQDLDIILAKCPREPDGSIRVVASRFLPGKVIGPIPFLGVREDDPNDVIPHEHRRELRGYRVLCSWLNHNDSREINSLDTWVEEDGRRFVKHYIQDLNATLGSASIFPNLRSEGFEHQFDLKEMGRELVTLGLYERPWTSVQFPKIRGVGNFEADHFDPLNWKANYPFPPFDNMTPQDAFWAAKIIVRFDNDLLREIVETAEYSDPAATEYVLKTLAERRDRIGRYWFSRVNPLDEFEIARMPSAASSNDPAGGLLDQLLAATTKPGGIAAPLELRFTDLAVRCGYETARRTRARVRGPGGKLVDEIETDATAVPLAKSVAALGNPAAGDVQARLLEIELRSAGAAGELGPKTMVTLYLEPSGSLRVAAIEREAS